MLRVLKFVVPVLILTASCRKGFLDINKDPNNPETVEVKLLLPTAQRALGEGLSIGPGDKGGLSQMLSVYVHQISTREEADDYGIDGADFFLGVAWPKLFATLNSNAPIAPIGVMKNLETIIKQGTADKNMQYVGIAKILKAYTYSQLVDVFGDVPFSEATQPDILSPKFDDDATIYPKLFTLIDEGISNIRQSGAGVNLSKPLTDDVMYGGDTAKWIRAANTIKLKLYTQIRKKQDVTAQVNQLLTANYLISATNQSFLVPFGPNGATDDRNPAFADYTATQRSNHISPWFYEIMKGYNKNIFTGITDPRLPYYIYNQIPKTDASREGSQTEYRDSAFVSIYFGSTGPDKDRIQQNTISVVGIYPAGGRYDDGGAEKVSGSSGTGGAPYRLITYADRLYIEAELIKEGLVAGNARTKLIQAINESMKQVDYVVTTYVKPSQIVPSIAASGADTVYRNKIMAEYDAKPAQQLEIIMTQKWLSVFGSAVDAYSDYRRTGFPILFDPNNPAMAPGGFVTPPKNGDPVNPGDQKPVPVSRSRDYPNSLPWYATELETNKNAPAQKLPASAAAKVFWQL